MYPSSPRAVCLHSRVNRLWTGYKDTDLVLFQKKIFQAVFFPPHPFLTTTITIIMLLKSIVSLACIAVAAAQATKGKSFDHIFIVFLENTVS